MVYGWGGGRPKFYRPVKFYRPFFFAFTIQLCPLKIKEYILKIWNRNRTIFHFSFYFLKTFKFTTKQEQNPLLMFLVFFKNHYICYCLKNVIRFFNIYLGRLNIIQNIEIFLHQDLDIIAGFFNLQALAVRTQSKLPFFIWFNSIKKLLKSN